MSDYESRTIRDAVEELNRTYYLPAIQREFEWDTYRIEKLFDSIMGDYPISSFLFWKVREENKKDWIAYEFARNFDKENPHNNEADLSGVNKDIYFILDGQQRLTSFLIGLKGSYKYFYYRWRYTKLYLNLLKPIGRNDESPEELEHHFEFRESEEPNNFDIELWYEIGRILDFKDAEDAKADIRNLIAHLDEKQQDNANKLIGRLHNRIHTNRFINYYEETDQNYDKVVETFIRANTGGKILEYSDILLSTATAKWKTLNAREEIHAFTDEINKTGAGYSFGKDFVLKGALYLTDDLPIKYKVSNFTKSNLEKIEANWQNIKKGIEDTIKLISKFGFSNKNITASMALLPIAYYLIKINKNNYINSSKQYDVYNQTLIQKWLIMVLLRNSFGGSSDATLSNLRVELSSIKDYSKFPIDILNKRLGIGMSFTEEEIEALLYTKYKTRYSYLILSLLYPNRDWKDSSFHEDHIFPKSQFTTAKLRDKGFDEQTIEEYQQSCDTILNLQLLTDSENREKSATDFDKWISTRDDSFKKRHKIPDLDSYDFDNFMEFISDREKILKSELSILHP